jgi:hypothetical protein
MRTQTIAEQTMESDHPAEVAEAWASCFSETKVGDTIVDRYDFIDESYLAVYYCPDGTVTHKIAAGK